MKTSNKTWEDLENRNLPALKHLRLNVAPVKLQVNTPQKLCGECKRPSIPSMLVSDSTFTHHIAAEFPNPPKKA